MTVTVTVTISTLMALHWSNPIPLQTVQWQLCWLWLWLWLWLFVMWSHFKGIRYPCKQWGYTGTNSKCAGWQNWHFLCNKYYLYIGNFQYHFTVGIRYPFQQCPISQQGVCIYTFRYTVWLNWFILEGHSIFFKIYDKDVTKLLADPLALPGEALQTSIH